MSARLAVDIGGTFTDVVLEAAAAPHALQSADDAPTRPSAACWRARAPSWPRPGAAPADVGLVVHGTTLATNALIERKGAHTALRHHRGLPRFARDRLASTASTSTTSSWSGRSRWCRATCASTVPERIDADGTVLLPLDEAAVRGVAAELRARRASRRWPSASCTASPTTAHERRAGAILAEELPGLAISLSLRGLPRRSANTSAPRPPSPTPMSSRAWRAISAALETDAHEAKASPARCC